MNSPKKHNLQEIKDLAKQLLDAIEDYERELYERRDLHSPEPTPRLRALRATMERLSAKDTAGLCRHAFELFLQNPKRASISFLQRKFSIGYGKAARVMEELEERGYVGASRGPNRPREILKSKWEDKPIENDDFDDDDLPPF